MSEWNKTIQKMFADEQEAQPTASVDSEPVAWLYTHPEAKPLLRHSRFPMSVPGWTETPLYTEAQMQARADAARREGEQTGLEKAAKAADEYNNHLTIGAAVSRSADLRDGLKNGAEVARMIATAIRSLKENPNAG